MKTDEAFVYMWTDFKKRYIGYHKGDIDDGYICSASEDFYKEFYSSSNWRRRILARGTAKQMIRLEHHILKRVDAKNNPRYFNKSNGGIYQKGNEMSTDFELISRIKDSLASRKSELMCTTYVNSLKRFQTRSLSTDANHVKMIAEKIKSSKSIANISSIVIVENTPDGTVLLDGNHTIKGAKQAKVAEVPVITLDYNEFNNNKLNLVGLGNALNHVEIVKRPPSDADIKQTLIQARKYGQDISDAEFKRQLAEATGRDVRGITIMSNNILEKGLNEGVFRVWADEELKEEQLKLQAAHPDAVVIRSATGAKMTERSLGDAIFQMVVQKKDRAILLLHHSKPKFAREFDNQLLHEAIESTGLTISVKVLDNVPI